ncbi:MAG: hypothetical protein VB095_02565 [Anaerovorax sp.]|nr:hypothetical protein [Anaerovorax sp.]
MDINEKLLKELANQVGFSGENEKSVKRAERMAENYKGKGEEELLKEILKLKQSMKADRAQYEKQIRAIRSLRGMMNAEQKARLDRLLQLLEDD